MFLLRQSRRLSGLGVMWVCRATRPLLQRCLVAAVFQPPMRRRERSKHNEGGRFALATMSLSSSYPCLFPLHLTATGRISNTQLLSPSKIPPVGQPFVVLIAAITRMPCESRPRQRRDPIRARHTTLQWRCPSIPQSSPAKAPLSPIVSSSLPPCVSGLGLVMCRRVWRIRGKAMR